MRILPIVLMVLASGCSYGTMRQRAKATDLNTLRVRTVWYNPNVHWYNSPWFRQEDLNTPARVVISNSNLACIMDNDVNEPLPGEYYTCPGKWRTPRP